MNAYYWQGITRYLNIYHICKICDMFKELTKDEKSLENQFDNLFRTTKLVEVY